MTVVPVGGKQQPTVDTMTESEVMKEAETLQTDAVSEMPKHRRINEEKVSGKMPRNHWQKLLSMK